MEGRRAASLAALWSLFKNLEKLRREKLPKIGRGGVDDIHQALLWVLNAFYKENDDNCNALTGMRKAVAAITENLGDAGIKEIEYDVFVDAVLNAAVGHVAGRRSSVDSVLFAPLNCYSAMPRKFVWICGLNDGVFPRIEARAAYDVIGRRSGLFDAPPRDQDAFALLKAALCAMRGGRLSFSYVGRSARDNQSVPPSVLLENLTDYFKRNGIGFARYAHPLTGYSRRCFQASGELPPAYSGVYLETAKHLAAAEGNAVAEARRFTAFPLAKSGVSEISLDDLADFFARPNYYLLKKRLDADVPRLERFDDRECLSARLDNGLRRRLALGLLDKAHGTLAAKLSVETGNAPDSESALEAINALKPQKIEFTKKKKTVYVCVDKNGQPRRFAEIYSDFLAQPEEEKTIELTVAGRIVRITLKCRTLGLEVRDHDKQVNHEHFFRFFDSVDYNSVKNEIAVWHLAVNAALDGGAASLAFSPDGKVGCRPLAKEMARENLRKLLELATGPLPEGVPDFGKTSPKNDGLPAKWQNALSDAVEFI